MPSKPSTMTAGLLAAVARHAASPASGSARAAASAAARAARRPAHERLAVHVSRRRDTKQRKGRRGDVDERRIVRLDRTRAEENAGHQARDGGGIAAPGLERFLERRSRL